MSQIIKKLAVVLAALSIAAAMSASETELPTEPETQVGESIRSTVSVVHRTQAPDQRQPDTEPQELGGAPSEPLKAE